MDFRPRRRQIVGTIKPVILYAFLGELGKDAGRTDKNIIRTGTYYKYTTGQNFVGLLITARGTSNKRPARYNNL
jgi:hypothetical protein